MRDGDGEGDIGSDLVTQLTIPYKLRISNLDIKDKGLTTLQSGQTAFAMLVMSMLSNIFF